MDTGEGVSLSGLMYTAADMFNFGDASLCLEQDNVDSTYGFAFDWSLFFKKYIRLLLYGTPYLFCRFLRGDYE